MRVLAVSLVLGVFFSNLFLNPERAEGKDDPFQQEGLYLCDKLTWLVPSTLLGEPAPDLAISPDMCLYSNQTLTKTLVDGSWLWIWKLEANGHRWIAYFQDANSPSAEPFTLVRDSDKERFPSVFKSLYSGHSYVVLEASPSIISHENLQDICTLLAQSPSKIEAGQANGGQVGESESPSNPLWDRVPMGACFLASQVREGDATTLQLEGRIGSFELGESSETVADFSATVELDSASQKWKLKAGSQTISYVSWSLMD